MLWEWDKSHINRLLWHAKTFGRAVVQCSFVDWDAFAQANQRIWTTSYQPRTLYAPWPTWQAWMAEHRALIATVQEVYEAQHGQQRDDQS